MTPRERAAEDFEVGFGTTTDNERGVQVMTDPDRPTGWRAVLLDRIRDLSVQHTWLLRGGFPPYEQDEVLGDMPLRLWRAQLHALWSEIDDRQTHARVIGIDEERIFAAQDAGQQGLSGTVGVDDPGAVRARILASIAEDIWGLEHMALVAVERHWRARGGAGEFFTPDSGVQGQYERNMDAIWARMAATASLAELTEAEQRDLFGRSPERWRDACAHISAIYGDTELEQRWRELAWPGIEHAAEQTRADLAATPGTRPAPQLSPPPPAVLLEHAATALLAQRISAAVFEHRQSPDPAGSASVSLRAALEVDEQWNRGATQSAEDLPPPVAESDTSTGLEH